MGTTPTFGFPYPDGSDLVISGDDVIEALATKLDDVLKPRWFIASAPTGAGGFTGAVVPGYVGGAVSTGPDWTWDGAGSFTFSGSAPRWHIVSAGASVYYDGLNSLSLQVNGAVVVKSFEGAPAGAGSVRNKPHSISVPILLNPSDVVRLSAEVSDGAFGSAASVEYAYLRGVSLR